MVGNDVIDLDAAKRESNWRRSGFLEKVFTIQEQNYISHSLNPDSMVWLLWSMKESTYKIFVRENHVRLIAPLKFKCRINSENESNISGQVISAGKNYFTNSIISKERISTTAYLDKIPGQKLLSGDLIFSGSRDSSLREEIISVFISEVSGFINIPSNDLSIKKDEFNIPYLFYKGKPLKSSVSFSHHGRFGLYSAEFF